jgi:hypothetical protein
MDLNISYFSGKYERTEVEPELSIDRERGHLAFSLPLGYNLKT